jgi:hypothetical protein
MIDASDPDTVIGSRDRVALVLGLALMGRRSQLVALELADLTETPDGLKVLIRASKTDQDARGAIIAVPPGQHPDTDPVRLVHAWRARLTQHGITEGRLLRSVTRHGRLGASLSADAVSDLVRPQPSVPGCPTRARTARTACGPVAPPRPTGGAPR